MKYSAVIFVVCAFFAMASARAVAESPDELSKEKRLFWPVVLQAAQALFGLQSQASAFCLANLLTLPSPLKRACSCVHSFDGVGNIFGDEEQQFARQSPNKRFFNIQALFNKVKDMVNKFCANDELIQKNPRLGHICKCLTG